MWWDRQPLYDTVYVDRCVVNLDDLVAGLPPHIGIVRVEGNPADAVMYGKRQRPRRWRPLARKYSGV